MRRLPIPTDAIAIEVAARDTQASAATAGQDADLVVDEAAVRHRQILALDSDTGAVAIHDANAGETQAADRHVVALHDERRLSHARPVGDHHARTAADDGQPVGAPQGAIVIGAGRDAHGVAIPGGGGVAGCGVGSSGADVQHSRSRLADPCAD